MKAREDGNGNPIVSPSAGTTQARGAAAEKLTADFLARRGLGVLGRNIRCRGGELDLVCLERGVIVFIEVRLRTHSRFGGAAASITATKQHRVILAARWWLATAGRRYANHPCRFDVVLLSSLDAEQIEWIRGAFDTDGS